MSLESWGHHEETEETAEPKPFFRVKPDNREEPCFAAPSPSNVPDPSVINPWGPQPPAFPTSPPDPTKIDPWGTGRGI